MKSDIELFLNNPRKWFVDIGYVYLILLFILFFDLVVIFRWLG